MLMALVKRLITFNLSMVMPQPLNVAKKLVLTCNCY
jgi:hypothetical protein